MRTQPIVTISAIFLAAMLFISPVWGESSGDQQVSYNSYDSYDSYEKFVDQQIQHNEFKATLGSAVSPNLLKNAEVSRGKADFLRENKDALVSNMGINNIEKKAYKMSRYLNQMFYGSFRSEGPLPGTDAIETYGGYIDKLIQHNEFKSALGSETSPNLLKTAEVSREKAEFLHNNRDRLISSMEVDNIEIKPYKMTHYLNQSFYDSIREGGSLLNALAMEVY